MIKKGDRLKEKEIHVNLVMTQTAYQHCLNTAPNLAYFLCCQEAPVTKKGILEVSNLKFVNFFFKKLSLNKWGEYFELLQKTLKGQEYELAIVYYDHKTVHICEFKDNPSFFEQVTTFENRYKFVSVAHF